MRVPQLRQHRDELQALGHPEGGDEQQTGRRGQGLQVHQVQLPEEVLRLLQPRRQVRAELQLRELRERGGGEPAVTAGRLMFISALSDGFIIQMNAGENKEEAERLEKEFRKNLSVPTVMAVPFLALNHYDALFMLIYLFVAIALLTYKNTTYPLPTYALASEGVILAMLSLTQLLRYHFAGKAVADKQTNYVVIYIIGSVFVLLSFIFMLRLQTYVILAEVITNWVGICFMVLETGCALWIIKVYQHKRRNQ